MSSDNTNAPEVVKSDAIKKDDTDKSKTDAIKDKGDPAKAAGDAIKDDVNMQDGTRHTNGAQGGNGTGDEQQLKQQDLQGLQQKLQPTQPFDNGKFTLGASAGLPAPALSQDDKRLLDNL